MQDAFQGPALLTGVVPGGGRPVGPLVEVEVRSHCESEGDPSGRGAAWAKYCYKIGAVHWQFAALQHASPTDTTPHRFQRLWSP